MSHHSRSLLIPRLVSVAEQNQLAGLRTTQNVNKILVRIHIKAQAFWRLGAEKVALRAAENNHVGST